MANDRREGGCRCGKVRFRVKSEPLLTAACHCTGCQRMTASAFSLTETYPDETFEIINGEPVLGGLHNPEQAHHHCNWCKSWLFTKVPIPGMPLVNVRATMFDDHAAFAPFVEYWTKEKLPWASTPAVHSFATEPEMDAYQALAEEFKASPGANA